MYSVRRLRPAASRRARACRGGNAPGGGDLLCSTVATLEPRTKVTTALPEDDEALEDVRELQLQDDSLLRGIAAAMHYVGVENQHVSAPLAHECRAAPRSGQPACERAPACAVRIDHEFRTVLFGFVAQNHKQLYPIADVVVVPLSRARLLRPPDQR